MPKTIWRYFYKKKKTQVVSKLIASPASSEEYVKISS